MICAYTRTAPKEFLRSEISLHRIRSTSNKLNVPFDVALAGIYTVYARIRRNHPFASNHCHREPKQRATTLLCVPERQDVLTINGALNSSLATAGSDSSYYSAKEVVGAPGASYLVFAQNLLRIGFVAKILAAFYFRLLTILSTLRCALFSTFPDAFAVSFSGARLASLHKALATCWMFIEVFFGKWIFRFTDVTGSCFHGVIILGNACFSQAITIQKSAKKQKGK